jgi:8-hydroxy-5-deazaflavin:NADPH oxidoreductase
MYCGDDARSKEVAAALIRDVGFEPAHAGPLRIARYTELCAFLMGQLGYDGVDRPELAYGIDRFKE